jgi:hypothetical protein
LDPAKSGSPFDRVLARLIQAEAHEPNPHFRDDYRQTQIAMITFWRGDYASFWDAIVGASYKMYGLHPLKLGPAIDARRRALLGSMYEQVVNDVRPAPIGQPGNSLLVSKSKRAPLVAIELPGISPRKKAA